MTDRLEVEVGGYRVQIRVDGHTGPVVVLCSGLGGRALHWSDTVAHLSDDHTVVRFDRPGTPTGAQPPLGGRLSVRAEADRISAVLDAVRGPRDAVVVGHSVGGFYAEAFARLYPRRTRAMLLLDSSIAPDRRWLPTLPLPIKLAAANAAVALLSRWHLQTALSRAGLELAQRRRPGGLDSRVRAEIHAAATEPGFPLALCAEYLGYHELAAELCTLRAVYPLPPVPRTVATAHTGWRTRWWRTQQIRLAETLGAEHLTISPSGHLVMIERPRRTADVIREIGRASAAKIKPSR
ncbi:alpha/beta hydrolase [Mycobacterium asiaticum]|uniref:AB hydrolase-1 domain-containing protein n=1 Tax=Mycobacterium asiaticum TaxID=1790 RepID=A0A1A3MUU5_MYCAS|nr:alpha/beta hydrolase [Mycobacterium asiaticum]OBK12579.1 hypothetical protein A5636_11200 [Mycobacterium asiaticum]